MKTVKIQGGLGNQLFGIAFAHSVFELTAGSVVLDVSSFVNYRYGHAFALADLAQALGLGVVSRPILGHRLTGAVMRHVPALGYGTDRITVDSPEALRELVHRHAYFDGYWQNEIYMSQPDVIARRVADFIASRAAITDAHDLVIHYRSYADETQTSRRGTPEAAYFQRALAHIQAGGGQVREILVVSDRPDLAAERVGDLGLPMRIVSSADPYADLSLMLTARHLILSNSSFSWWGGFCGTAHTVIYPRAEGLFHYPAPAKRFVCL